MNIHILQHEAFESPASIEAWIEQRAHNVTYTRFFANELLPDSFENIDLLIIMGGPQSPTTTQAECPYFDGKTEIAFIQKVIKANKKVLGICLGAQLIGEALGASVEHSPNREIGVFPVMLTPDSKSDILTTDLPTVFDVGHWHGDMPGLTAGCQVLAYSEGCPRQIIRYLPTVYAFQCHFEFNKASIESMIANCSHELDKFAGMPYVFKAEALLQTNYEPMNELLFTMLDKLINKD